MKKWKKIDVSDKNINFVFGFRPMISSLKKNSNDSECNVSIRNVLLNITRIFMKSKCNYCVACPSLILVLIEQESIFTFHSLRLLKCFSVAIVTLLSFYNGFPHILNSILFHYQNLKNFEANNIVCSWWLKYT